MSTNFGIEDQGSRSGSASKSNEASIREDARLDPTIRDDASAQETSETPTVWMWVLTFVAGISGVSFFLPVRRHCASKYRQYSIAS